METALGKSLTDDELDLLGRRLIAKYTATKQGMDSKWLPARVKYKKYAEGDYSDRNTRDESDIFSKNNIPLEFITGAADFMVARACEDIFGSEPYFAAVPQLPADEALGQQLPKHFSWKLGEAKFKTVGRQAIWRGFHIGEGIVKATWRRTVDKYERIAVILIDAKKKAVLDENGDFIFAEDSNLKEMGLSLWAKSEIVRMPEGAQFVVVPEVSQLEILVDAKGVPIPTGNGENWFSQDAQEVLFADEEPAGAFLCKSPIISQQSDETFEERLIEDEEVTYEGLDDALVDAGDFVAPLNIRHLSESDGNFHKLSLRRSVLRDEWGMDAAIEAKIGTDDQRPKNEAKQAQAGEGEPGFDPEEDDPEYECIECYAKVQIGDRMARVYALVEKKSEAVIVCDYLQNVTPRGLQPFAAIVPCPVPGRWHGRGFHEIYKSQSKFIDRTFNAII